MIQLSNKHAFEFVAASGALAFDGRGWPWEWPLRWIGILKPRDFTIVIKSLTLRPRRGNLRWYSPFRCVRLIKNGALNAVGLTNPGIEEWIEKIYPRISKSDLNVVASIAGENLQDNLEMAIRLRDCTALKALEINASCPNSAGELQSNAQTVIDTCKAVRAQVPFPVWVKLTCTQDYVGIAKALEGVVEAISINSVPWAIAYPGRPSPLARFGGGGVSGKVAQDFTWKMVRELSAQTKIPVIGAGVWDFEDIEKLFSLGAKAIAFGSIFLRYPWRPSRFVKKWGKRVP